MKSEDITPIKIIDVPGETLLVLVVYRDGSVHIETGQPPKWVAAALLNMADSVLKSVPEPSTGF